uniref:Transcriptional regulatory protein n=2 Tax=Magnetospirillum gryphiswaldense TaxID=55518 RepID=A4TVM6_9PROT|nr:Transcriptional regulatory protein [Magnetospirillum gryphiswaldense MSR-1]
MELTQKTCHAFIINLREITGCRTKTMTDNISDKISHDDILRMAVDVVSAYVSNNPLPAGQIPEIINTVYNSLAALDGAPVETKSEAPKPAISVKKSVHPDYIVCLEDGKKLKMLKRHLRTTYSMTPDEYRAKWGLPPDYPMVAPNYAAQRSDFAKKIGLGRKVAETEEKAVPAPTRRKTTK